MTSKIEDFCAVTGSDSNMAKSFLEMCNDDLETAVNMFMSDSTSEAPIIPPDPDYRAPIPTRTERLVPLDIHHYIPIRRTVTRGAFSGNLTVFGDDNEDLALDVIDLCSSNENGSSNQNPININDVSGAGEASNRVYGSVSSSGSEGRKQGILRQIFAPPIDLLFDGSLRHAHEAARQQKRWLLVSVHDESCFDCHILNRDVWKDYRISSLIKQNFLFIQIDVNSPDGVMYRSRYTYVNAATHLAIINPVSGEQEIMWTHLKDVDIINTALTDFLLYSKYPNDPNGTTANGSDPSTTSSSRHRCLRRPFDADNASPSASSSFINASSSKRPRYSTVFNLTSHLASIAVSSIDVDETEPEHVTARDPILDLTEEEQLELALKASVEDAAGPSSPSSPSSSSGTSITRNVKQLCLPRGLARTKLPTLSFMVDEDDDECELEISANSDKDKDLADALITNDFESKSTVTSQQSSPLSILELPRPSDPRTSFRLAVRMPDGQRTVWELDPNLRLEILMRYMNSLNYPSSDYELIRVYPRLSLTSLPASTRLSDCGLFQTDSLFLQEK